MSPDLLYFNDLFDTLQHNETGYVDSSINQFSQNISFSGKRAIRIKFCPTLAQNYSILYLMIYHRDFFETFQHDQTQKVDNNNIGQFPQKSCFSAIGQSEPILGQNYATLYRKQLPNDMLSKILEMLSYDWIQYLDQSNVSQFTPKIPFQARAIDLILAEIIQHYIS